MTSSSDLVAATLRNPAGVSTWTAQQWSQLVQQARAAGLLARLAQRLGAVGTLPSGPWPPAADGHIESALRVTAAQHAEIVREVGHIRKALAALAGPVVLLKGAAYVIANLPASQGRVFSDVDIMVSKAELAQAESALTAAGWMTTHHSEYDQRYYRQWMHELPPMEHATRHTVIDVHHTILPETARLRPDPRKLFAAAVPIDEAGKLFVLAPADMVLHSMTHLFMNDDMSHALRDLSDLDLLLRHFGAGPGFWSALPRRAAELQLQRPLYYGLRYAQRVLDTPVPTETTREVGRFGPVWPLRAAMDAIWLRALRTPHPSAAPPLRGLALFALYVRGHWLRMPPWLLARHLTVKALRLHERRTEDAGPANPR